MSEPETTETTHAEIRARLDAATPGPWHGPHEGELVCVSLGEYGWVCSGVQSPEYDVDSEQGMADAEFIAHAPTDIAALLTENDDLRVERDALTAGVNRLKEQRNLAHEALVVRERVLKGHIGDVARRANRAEAELAAAQAEIERLRGENASLIASTESALTSGEQALEDGKTLLKLVGEKDARIAEQAATIDAVRDELARSFAMSAVNADPHGAWREAVAYVREAVLAVLPPTTEEKDE